MHKNNLKSILFLNVASILRNIYGLARSKITALVLGVTGVGILGQITTLFSLQTKLVSFGVDAFLINRIGKLSSNDDSDEFKALTYFSFFIIICINSIYIGAVYIFIDKLSILIFNDIEYKSILLLTIILGPLYAISYNFQVISQAKTDFKRLAFGRNLSSIFAIVVTIPLIYYLKIKGIIFSLYIFIIIGGIYFAFINRSLVFDFSMRYVKYFGKYFSEFFRIGLTDVIRKIVVFFSLMIFRIMIVQFIGMKQNGFFQAIWSISFYPDIFLTAFISYYFPIVSRAKNDTQLREIIHRNFEYLIYLIFPIIVFIILFPDFLLIILFNKSFVVMANSLKILTFFKFLETMYFFYLISFLAQTKLKAFLISEISRSVVLLVSGYFLINSFALNGTILSIVLMQITSISMIFFWNYKYSNFRLTKDKFKSVFLLVLSIAILLIPVSHSIILRIFQFLVFLIFTIKIFDFRKYAQTIV